MNGRNIATPTLMQTGVTINNGYPPGNRNENKIGGSESGSSDVDDHFVAPMVVHTENDGPNDTRGVATEGQNMDRNYNDIDTNNERKAGTHGHRHGGSNRRRNGEGNHRQHMEQEDNEGLRRDNIADNVDARDRTGRNRHGRHHNHGDNHRGNRRGHGRHRDDGPAGNNILDEMSSYSQEESSNDMFGISGSINYDIDDIPDVSDLEFEDCPEPENIGISEDRRAFYNTEGEVRIRNEIRKNYPMSLFVINDYSEDIKIRRNDRKNREGGNILADEENKEYEIRPDTCLKHNSRITCFKRNMSGHRSHGDNSADEQMEPLCIYCDGYQGDYLTFDDADQEGGIGNLKDGPILSVGSRLEQCDIEDSILINWREKARRLLPVYKGKIEELKCKLEESLKKKQSLEDRLREQNRNNDRMLDIFRRPRGEQGLSLTDKLRSLKEEVKNAELYNVLEEGIENLIHIFDPSPIEDSLSHVETEIKAIERDKREALILLRMLKVVALTKSWSLISHKSTKIAHLYLQYLGFFSNRENGQDE